MDKPDVETQESTSEIAPPTVVPSTVPDSTPTIGTIHGAFFH